MVKVAADGQLFWNFDSLDFDGALEDLHITINVLLDYRDELLFGSEIFEVVDSKIKSFLKISLYLERLKVGQMYV